jgi:cyanate lyase
VDDGMESAIDFTVTVEKIQGNEGVVKAILIWN